MLFINGGFQIGTDLPCTRTVALSRFHEKSVLFQLQFFPRPKRRWYSGEHSCLPSS